MSEAEKAEALAHIAGVAESHRAARGTIEAVSWPRTRRVGRRLQLVLIRIAELIGRLGRRLGDSHKLPGRGISRVKMLRVTKTFSFWFLLWLVVAGGCAYLAFKTKRDEDEKWVLTWALSGALAALVSVAWHDVVKGPRVVRQVRRRIAAEPEALLRTTLAKQGATIVQLDPPVNTVPRDELYDELLPGALARKKDVQIVVGDPGAGKTTALLDLARVLAKIGFVPVLLELRGELTDEDLFDRARKRFEQQARPFLKTDADANVVWRWLCRRQRVAILVDDIDQIGCDGEPGFVMRRLLENVATEGQAVIVTARPAGVPMGIAASAISIEPLDPEIAVKIAAKPKEREAGANIEADSIPRGEIERWVTEGELTEAPLYLEALAELTAVNACPDLPDDPGYWGAAERPGRWRERSATRRSWSPLWVRYMLLDRYYGGIVKGRVRPSLGIDRKDRERSVKALEGAALGALGATGLEAAAAAEHGDEPVETREGQPKRGKLVDFISADDREDDPDAKGGRRGRRPEVSQHEAIDTCERLRILEPDWQGEPQFRHRIMQAFLAGKALAELGRKEAEAGELKEVELDRARERVCRFDAWVRTLLDARHPEKLTAHLVLVFAAVHADAQSIRKPGKSWGTLADWIVKALLYSVKESTAKREEKATAEKGPEKADCPEGAELFDPTRLSQIDSRFDPDDDLIKLTTAAQLASLLRHPAPSRKRPGWPGTAAGLLWRPKGSPNPLRHRGEIVARVKKTTGAMRWTKLRAVSALAELGGQDSWNAIWRDFAGDSDYNVRRAAGQQLEVNACEAYDALHDKIESHILRAGLLAAEGRPLQSEEARSERANSDRYSWDAFEALGWALPAIVSGLSEEPPGESPGERLTRARDQLVKFATLAYEGCRPKLEDSLAQGFKADAMRHASEEAHKGPGWVAPNRRLAADVCLPHAESWYARMLLYQALAMYAVAGASREDTLDVLSYRLHGTRERHPLARRAAKLARAGQRRGEFGSSRWEAFVWSDKVEDAGGLPAILNRKAAQLVGDVSLLVDLKEGSPPDLHEAFGHMEELPHCLSASKNRHEILGTGCPPHCGWGFCPYRASSPDEPKGHRGLSRGFSRGERRLARPGTRVPPWQRRISRRNLRKFWEQMEFKARR